MCCHSLLGMLVILEAFVPHSLGNLSYRPMSGVSYRNKILVEIMSVSVLCQIFEKKISMLGIVNSIHSLHDLLFVSRALVWRMNSQL